MEIDMLYIVAQKDNYERFKPLVKEQTLSKEAALVYASVGMFYDAYPTVTAIDWNDFESYFFVLRNSQVAATARTAYRNLFDKLRSHKATLGTDIVLKYFINLSYGLQIGNVAVKVAEGKADMAQIALLVDEHHKEVGMSAVVKSPFVDGDISSIMTRAASKGLDWRLEELNISCGPVRQGDFILIAAYVGTGKTTFGASEITHMASQLTDNRPVIWVNNEEESNKVLMRITQAALGCTLHDLMADEARAKADYEKLMGMPNRILVTQNDSSVCNVSYLTSLFRKHNPAIILFDQLDKVAGFEKQSDGKEYERLGRLYKWARECSHLYGPVFAISQTDGGSGADQFIRMHQLRGSKVDKPGEADAIITIGKINDPARSHDRFIHVPKNKMTGGPRSDESKREGFWEVKIKPEVARYVGTK